ncbi:MAG: hypothetical protein Q8R01_18180 [Ramlibacter sp.]|nr:hypothetical protein [Ramlibacter sp.]
MAPFSPHEKLTPLNRALLRETAVPSGGAGGRDVVPSVFRRADPAGAGYMAPVVAHEGGYAVDLGVAEASVAALYGELAQLKGRVAQLDAAVVQRARGSSGRGRGVYSNSGANQGRGGQNGNARGNNGAQGRGSHFSNQRGGTRRNDARGGEGDEEGNF